MVEPTVGVVVLTQGTRPEALTQAVESVRSQAGVQVTIVVVGNGWDPACADPALPSDVIRVALPENLGIPAGRNRGVDRAQGQWLFFLDDDALLPESTFLRDAIAVFERDPSLGMLQPRIEDPQARVQPRRWVPRIRKNNPSRSSPVFSVIEMAILMPRATFDATGGWAEPFFYAHEGIDLAWKVWDHSQRVWYCGDLVVHHPAVSPTRHAEYFRLNARNRVWLARRNLPMVLVPLYVGSWTGIQLMRWWGKPSIVRVWFGGWRDGWREYPGARTPLRWKTVWRMTRAGRPPII